MKAYNAMFSEKLKSFTAAHPCENVTVDGARFRYILNGKDSGMVAQIYVKSRRWHVGCALVFV